jgi:hypothetical protein
MGKDRYAIAYARNGEFEQSAALAIGEADGFADVHGKRQRLRAVGDVEIEEFPVDLERDAAIVRERRHRRVHQAWRQDGHF